MLLLNLMLAWQMLVFKHFNTSYVVIKHTIANNFNYIYFYFNTSYVVIKREIDKYASKAYANFNTSYVVIKRYCI